MESSSSTGDPSTWLTICVTKGEMLIGRASAKHAERAAKTTNMYFENSHLSKAHARLLIEDGVFYLEDMGSTFGTFWRDCLLIPHNKVALSEGDHLGFVLNKPSHFIQGLIQRANGHLKVTADNIVNARLQLLFSVVSLDAEEGSLVLLPLSGVDSLGDSRKKYQAKIARTTLKPDSAATKEEVSLGPGCAEDASSDESIIDLDSDGPPIEESYEREFSQTADSAPVPSSYQVTTTASPKINTLEGLEIAQFVDSASSDSSDGSSDGVSDIEDQSESECHEDVSGPETLLHNVAQNEVLTFSDKFLKAHENDEPQERVEVREAGYQAQLEASHEMDTSTLSDDDTSFFNDCCSKNFDDSSSEHGTGASTISPSGKQSGRAKSVHFESDSETFSNDPWSPGVEVESLKTKESNGWAKANVFGNNENSEEVESDGDDSSHDSDDPTVPLLEVLCHDYLSEDDEDAAFDTLEYSSEEEVAFSEDEIAEAHAQPETERSVLSNTSRCEVYESPNSVPNCLNVSAPSQPSPTGCLYSFQPLLSKQFARPLSLATLVKDRGILGESRKRTREVFESESENDGGLSASSELSAPKRTRTKVIAREVSKGLMYVAGTLAALVAYGGYLERSGLQL